MTFTSPSISLEGLDGANRLPLVVPMAAAFDPVCHIYGAVIDPASWKGVFAYLYGALRFNSAGIAVSDPEHGQGRMLHATGIDNTFQQLFGNVFGPLAAELEEPAEQPQMTIYTIDTQLSKPGSKAAKFFVHWLKPQGLRFGLCGQMMLNATAFITVFFWRQEQGRAFTRVEAEQLRPFMQHLRAAARLAMRLQPGHRDPGALFELLDQLPIGAIALDGRGHPIKIGRFAAELIAEFDGLYLGRTGLEAAGEVETLAMREIFRAAAAGRNGQVGLSLTTALSRPSGKRPLSLLVVPTPRVADPGENQAAALVFVNDPERLGLTDENRLAQVYGLTRSEARLAVILAYGCRLEEAAREMRISLNTARTHLQRIFSKTGSQRQAELVRLLLTGPARIWAA